MSARRCAPSFRGACGFRRVVLAAGAVEQVGFALNPRDGSMVTEAGAIVVAPGEYTVSIGGGRPGAGAPTVTGNFSVQGTLTPPE